MIMIYGLENHDLSIDKNIIIKPNNSKGTYNLELISSIDNQFDVYKIGFVLNKEATANAIKGKFNGKEYDNVSLYLLYEDKYITVKATDTVNNKVLFNFKEKLESIIMK